MTTEVGKHALIIQSHSNNGELQRLSGDLWSQLLNAVIENYTPRLPLTGSSFGAQKSLKYYLIGNEIITLSRGTLPNTKAVNILGMNLNTIYR